MKSALEIMDNFTDDLFGGIRDSNISGINEGARKKLKAWNAVVDDIATFISEIAEYRRIQDKEKRSAMAEKLVDTYLYFQTAGFFKFVESSVISLKLKILELRKDNKDLARELGWYKQNYPDAQPFSSVRT